SAGAVAHHRWIFPGAGGGFRGEARRTGKRLYLACTQRRAADGYAYRLAAATLARDAIRCAAGVDRPVADSNAGVSRDSGERSSARGALDSATGRAGRGRSAPDAYRV